MTSFLFRRNIQRLSSNWVRFLSLQPEVYQTIEPERRRREWSAEAEPPKDDPEKYKVHFLNIGFKQNLEGQWQLRSALTTRDLVDLVGKCRFLEFPKEAWILQLLNAIDEKASTLEHVQLSSTMHSLAVFVRKSPVSRLLLIRIQDTAILLAETLCSNMEGIRERNLANAMYALGILFKNNREGIQNRPRLLKCVQTLSKEIFQERHLLDFSQQGLANVVYAYGCLHWKADAVLIRLGKEIMNRICGFRSQEIANMIFALAKLKFYNEPLILTLAVEAAAPDRATTFTEQELCNILHGLTVLSPSMSNKFQPIMKRLIYESGSLVRMPKYSDQDISTLVYCIATNQQGQKMNNYTTKLMSALLGRFQDPSKKMPLDRELSKILYACARLEYRNEDFLKNAIRNVHERCKEFKMIQSVTVVLWALTKLNALTPVIFINLCKQIIRLRAEGQPLNDQNWVQLTQAIQFTKKLPEKVELDPQIRDLLEEALSTPKDLK